MDRVLTEYTYHNYQVTFPLVQIKYADKGDSHPVTTNFMYGINNIANAAVDERFDYIDDRVLNNIIYHRYLISTYGRVFDRVKGKFLNLVINKPGGYYKVKLSYYSSWNTLEYKDVYIARAVKLMFDYYPGAEFPAQSGIQIMHINNDHSDNRLVNLQYIFPFINNLQNNNIINNNEIILIDHNYTISDPRQPIRIICSMLQSGCSNKEISEKTGVPGYIISDIRQGKNYKSFSAEYSIPRNVRNRVDDSVIIKICEMIEHGYRNFEIANTLGVTQRMVAEIKTRRNYTYISCDYKW